MDWAYFEFANKHLFVRSIKMNQWKCGSMTELTATQEMLWWKCVWQQVLWVQQVNAGHEHVTALSSVSPPIAFPLECKLCSGEWRAWHDAWRESASQDQVSPTTCLVTSFRNLTLPLWWTYMAEVSSSHPPDAFTVNFNTTTKNNYFRLRTTKLTFCKWLDFYSDIYGLLQNEKS